MGFEQCKTKNGIMKGFCDNKKLFTPTMLVGLHSWYKSTAGVTIAGGGVDVWADQSGGGHDLIAVSPTRRPTLANNELNGFPGIVFSSDQLLKTAPFTLNQPETIFIVYKKITNPRGYVFDGLTDNTGALIHELNDDLTIGCGALIFPPLSTTSLGSFNLVTAIFESNNGVLQLNNTSENTGNPGLLNMGGFTLGGPGTAYGYFCNMSVVEIIITTTHATITDRNNVKTYVSDEYGI